MRVRHRSWVLILLLAAVLTGCGSKGPTPGVGGDGAPARLRLAVPEAWLEQYAAVLDGPENLEVVPAGGPADARDALRRGEADLALTWLAPGQDGEGQAFREEAVAFIAPLTLPLEGLDQETAAGAVAGRDVPLLGGRVNVEAWDAQAVRLLWPEADVQEVPAAEVVADVSSRRTALGLVPWDGPYLRAKAVRIDGKAPGDQGYPLVLQRAVVAGERDDARKAAEDLATRLVRMRPAEQPRLTLAAVGDVMLDRTIGDSMRRHGDGYPWERVAPVLTGADIAFGNLEVALTEANTPEHKDFTFRAPPSAAAALAAAGFDVMALANNHTLDYGVAGIVDGAAALREHGVQPVGAGGNEAEARSPVFVEARGLTIAFVACVAVENDGGTGYGRAQMAAGPGRPGVYWCEPAKVAEDVRAAKERSDLVVLSMHAGWEYTETPNEIQRTVAHAAIDAGAALVLGGHPHVLQGVEYYGDGVIVYSLGNFVFDDPDAAEPAADGTSRVLSVIFRVTLDRDGVRGIEFIPVVHDEAENRPVLAEGPAAAQVLARLYRLTDALN